VSAGLLIARLFLAVVFGVSGTAKLADLEGTRQAAAGFGLPAWAGRPVAVALPAVELAVAAALLPATTAAAAGWAALGLLAVFSAVVAASLARGRRPACHCFGQIRPAPVGWRTLARNAALGAVAAFIAVAGWPDGGASLGQVGFAPAATRIAVGGLLAAVAALAVLVLVLLGRYGAVLHRLDQLQASVGGQDPAGARHRPPAGLPVGAPAPDFTLTGLDGEPLTLAALRAPGHPVLLMFGDPRCEPCQSLLPELARWQADQAGRLTAALISRGTVAANRAEADRHRLRNVAVQRDQEVAAAYRYPGTPSAVAVSADGRVASPVVSGPDAIRSLAATLLRQDGSAAAARPVPLRPGQPAPAVTLTDLDGRPAGLTSAGNGPLVVLFWNPACGYCQQALEQVRIRELGPVGFVFVSAGQADQNRALGLRSPVLLDPDFATARAFGASGTPSAVLVGADGQIASELAVGAPAVLALADAAIAASAGHPA
jgi:peroxiredoxin/uncharacterized membrane protein YphA (DoxX/SURF4 family)